MNIWMDVDTALSEVPVNIASLIDDTDFKTREESVVYNQAGLDLVWNFITTAGAFTQTAVTPTTSGVYDWTNQTNGIYTIEIPASGGGSINNDTEGFGWFIGFATGILPWRGPIIGFRAAVLNNALVDGGDLLDVNITHVADTSQTAGDIAALINALNDLTSIETAEAVWDALLASYDDIDSFGEKINDIGSAADLSDAIWDETKSGHVSGGSFGEEVQLHSLSTELSTHDGKLDTVESKIDTIDSIVDQILDDTGTSGVVVASGSKTGYELTASGIDDIWDEVVEGSATARQLMRGILAAVAGKTTDGGTKFRDIDDTKDRIVVVTDSSKNRTSITFILT